MCKVSYPFQGLYSSAWALSLQTIHFFHWTNPFTYLEAIHASTTSFKPQYLHDNIPHLHNISTHITEKRRKSASIYFSKYFSDSVSSQSLVLEAIHHRSMVQDNDRGEPAFVYKWTGWVWEITGWSSRLQENYPSFFLEKFIEHTSI
jgi:hypothetical protein